MTDRTNGDSNGGHATTKAADELTVLRQLLLGQEQEQIEEIRERLDDPELSARDVARVLAEAIRLRAENDEDLAGALGPTISDAFNESVRRDPKKLADAVSPIMGPAIRRSIVQTIRGMMQSLNRTLDQSFSLQGLKWRLEAWRTQKSFGEVVLLHTLIYEVDQVFLVDRQAGLQMQHVARDPESATDTEVISAMLTAIQDFVRDSFGAKDTDTLDTLNVGEHTVWIEQGAHAYLAVVFRGEAPSEFRNTMHETLEEIHANHDALLSSFDGNTQTLEVCRDSLERCLQAQFVESETKSPVKAILAVVLVVLLMFGGIGYWTSLNRADEQRWQNYVESFRDEPGFVVIRAERNGGGPQIQGLRDPLAREPKYVAQWHDDVEQTWQTYQSSEPAIIARRVVRTLDPPDEIVIKGNKDGITISGETTKSWIEQARTLATHYKSFIKIDTTGLVDIDAPWHAYLRRLEKEPGIVVVNAEKRNGRYFVMGLREPISIDPAELLDDFAITLEIDAHWDRYDPVTKVDQVRAAIQPPDTIDLKVIDGVAILSGSARHDWIQQALRAKEAGLLPSNVQTINTAAVVDLDAEQFAETRSMLVSKQVFFVERDQLTAESVEAVKQIASLVRQLNSAGQASEKRYTILLKGHAVGDNAKPSVKRTSQLRADTVKQLLIDNGIDDQLLTTKGVGSAEQNASNDDTEPRRVTIEVIAADEAK